MAVQLTLTDISSGYQGTDIQANFTAIEDEFDKVLYRDGSLTVTDTIDMNSQRLVNLPAPTSSTEPLRKDDQFTTDEAQQFATDAETAKDAAEAALETFQSQYVGESATDPTTDGNGDALTEGDLYFDTTNNLLKAYDGSSWINPALLYFPNVDANVTATEDELNLLDGVTATTAELNLLDDFYQTDSIALDGDFSSGNIEIARVGKLITITGTFSAHLDETTPSTTGIIPGYARPNNVMHVVSYFDSLGLELVQIQSGGTLVIAHRDWTGSARTATSSKEFTISYKLAD